MIEDGFIGSVLGNLSQALGNTWILFILMFVLVIILTVLLGFQYALVFTSLFFMLWMWSFYNEGNIYVQVVLMPVLLFLSVIFYFYFFKPFFDR